MNSLEDLEKKINSELTTKINNSEIKHNQIFLETDKDDFLDVRNEKKFEVEISAVYIIEAEDYEEAKDEVLMNYTIDKHDLEINELEDEEVSDE